MTAGDDRFGPPEQKMISILSITLILLSLTIALVHTVLVINYVRFLRDGKDIDAAQNQRPITPPRAAIVLYLRGYEIGVPACLAELVGQNYENFELHIAFDSDSDPAVKQVREFFDNRSDLAKLHFFQPLNQCSYKCSAIVHVVEALDQTVDFVAFCDTRTTVDESWLTRLVQPMLDDEQIGATTGSPWFAPSPPSIWAVIRKYWNSATVAPVSSCNIPWAGSMALRRTAVERSGLVERWSKSFSEDVVVSDALAKANFKIRRIPDMIIVNRESMDLRDCLDWLTRKLTAIRLHHWSWPILVVHAIAVGSIAIAIPIVILYLLVCGHVVEARSMLIAWLIYQFVNSILLAIVSRQTRIAIASQDETVADKERARHSLLLKAGSFAALQVIHPLAVLKSAVARSVRWKAVQYRIDRKRVSISK